MHRRIARVNSSLCISASFSACITAHDGLALGMTKTHELLMSLLGSGLSQAEISKQTGIPQSRLSRWEDGLIPIGAEYALKLRECYEKVRRSQSRKQRKGEK